MSVLRLNPDSSISHIHYVTYGGNDYYLLKKDFDKMNDFSFKNVEEYFCGDDHEELNSLRESVWNLLSGEHSIKEVKLRIAISTGLIEYNRIHKM